MIRSLADAGGMTGVALTSAAFQSVFPWFGVVLAIAVLLFAFSTMISWSYYGLKCWAYLFGESQISELTFKLIFCVFVVIGCSMSLGPVIDFSDAAIFAMSLGNVLGLYLLMGTVNGYKISLGNAGEERQRHGSFIDSSIAETALLGIRADGLMTLNLYG